MSNLMGFIVFNKLIGLEKEAIYENRRIKFIQYG